MKTTTIITDDRYEGNGVKPREATHEGIICDWGSTCGGSGPEQIKSHTADKKSLMASLTTNKKARGCSLLCEPRAPRPQVIRLCRLLESISRPLCRPSLILGRILLAKYRKKEKENAAIFTYTFAALPGSQYSTSR